MQKSHICTNPSQDRAGSLFRAPKNSQKFRKRRPAHWNPSWRNWNLRGRVARSPHGLFWVVRRLEKGAFAVPNWQSRLSRPRQRPSSALSLEGALYVWRTRGFCL